MEIRAQITALIQRQEGLNKNQAKYNPTVEEEDIAEIVAAWTGIPVSKVSKSETEKLLKMEEILHSRVIGQDKAVMAISRTYF